jgi:hypothetical protein
MKTLEERIASALTDNIASSDLAALILETEESIALADKTADAERVKALDPSPRPIPLKRAPRWRMPPSAAIVCVPSYQSFRS